jgi:bacteriorhodopsin
MLIPYHHHLVDTGYMCHTWHIMDVDPLSPSFGWYGISVSIMTVTQISRINQVMVIGDQHPLYVMCDTDIPYQPSDGDRGSTIPYHHHLVDTGYMCHTWHIMDVDPLSPSFGWYRISMSCVTQISRINQVMVIGDQHPLYVMCDTDIPYQPSDGYRGSTSIISHVWHRYPVSTKWWW